AHVFIDLGIRKEEGRNLQFHHFDPEGAVVIVHGKGGKERPVPGSDELWRAYWKVLNRPIPNVVMRDERGEYKEDRKPLLSDYLLFEMNAMKPGRLTRTPPDRQLSQRAVHDWWERQVIARAGIKYRSLHMARHTVGTDLVDADADTFTVRDWLGHA